MCQVHIRASDIVAVHKNLQIKKKLKKRDAETRDEIESKYVCQKCGGTYATEISLFRHKKYTCDAEAKFTCDSCSYKSKYKSHLRGHMLNVHLKTMQYIGHENVKRKKPESGHKCNKCERSYKYETSLIFHKRYVCGVEPKFECDFCKHKSKYKSALLAHIQRIHSKNS